MYHPYWYNYPHGHMPVIQQNPGHFQNNPGNPNEQVCRDRCYKLGFRPGTAGWRYCIHGCQGNNGLFRDQSLPDQWVTYIQPLVDMALEEVDEGINLTHLFQEYILAGVLVGQGFPPETAIQQVESWEKGESKLLQQSKKNE
ncbi:hypothetical protein [Halobacillus litoralis]|uniref:Uncharacterized protein n=1 Tax=Halobacillus litoralis TaxID=45668 RepID=A0A410M9B9_9BACI|nr:hypothetical protein [Halobacillus litoralis]QAS51331.1 hypothetical protein HLI_03435 [Halobacillus litoralis]